MGIGNNLGNPLTRLARARLACAETSLHQALSRTAFVQADIENVEQRIIAVNRKMSDLLEHLSGNIIRE